MVPEPHGPVRPTPFSCVFALVTVFGVAVVLADAALDLRLGVFQTWWGGDLRWFVLALGAGLAIRIVGNIVGRQSWGLVTAIYFAVVGSLVPVLALQLLVQSRIAGWILGSRSLWFEVPWLLFALVSIGYLAWASIHPRSRAFYRTIVEDRYAALDSDRSVRGAVSLNYVNDLCAATMAFAYVNALLVSHGAARVEGGTDASGYDLYVAALKTQVLELLAAVPLLDLPRSLRLDVPLQYTDRWTGLMEISFKLTVIAALVPMLRYLLKSDLSVATTVARGESLLRQGDPAGAEKAFRQADQEGDARAAYVVGEFLEEREELVDAEAAYRRADDRGYPPGTIKLIALLQRRGDHEGAEIVLTAARARDPFFELPSAPGDAVGAVEDVDASTTSSARPRHIRE